MAEPAPQGGQCSPSLAVVSDRYSGGPSGEEEAENFSPICANKKRKALGAVPVGERSARAAPFCIARPDPKSMDSHVKCVLGSIMTGQGGTYPN